MAKDPTSAVENSVSPIAQRSSARCRRWMRHGAWAAVGLLIALAVLSCVVRVAWLTSTQHPAGETMIDVTLEKGSLLIWSHDAAINASPVTVTRTIFNRQIEVGVRPRVGYERGLGFLSIEIPFFTIALGVAASISAELIRRRYFSRPSAGRCRCGYVLSGLGAAGTCPECGERYGPAG